MPQADLLNDILKTLQYQQAKKARQFEESLSTKELEQRTEQQKAQLDQRIKEHENLVKQQDIVNKTAKQIHDLDMFNKKQSIAQGVVEGKPIPGLISEPITQSPQGFGYTPANPAAATSTNNRIMIGDQMVDLGQLPTPEVYERDKAARADIANKSKYEHDLDKLQLQGDLKFAQTELQRLMIAAQNRETQFELNERARKNLEYQESRDTKRHDIMLKAIEARNTAGLDVNDNQLNDYYEKLSNGDMTRKQFAALWKGTKEGQVGTKILRAFTQANGPAMEDNQQQAISNYKALTRTAKLMDELITMSPKDDSAAEAWLKGSISRLPVVQSEASVKEAELEGHSAMLARELDNQKGSLSDKDIIISSKGKLPKITQPYKNKITLRNDFVKQLKEKFKADFHNMPPDRLELLMEKSGLNNINDTYTAPATQQTSPQPSVSVPTQPAYSPAAIEIFNRLKIPLPQ